ncbi:MAG: hypothetical protein K2X95_08965 [Flavobacteriaceae bacterium]|nr:hypothetical protein [Flavobacteriaceae bacterium]
MSFGQTAGEKILHGKTIVGSHNIAGVTIINLVNEKSTVSDSNGEFFILAKADDLLVFSSVNLEYHRRQIEEEDLKPDLLIIKMIAKITELEEVIVNKHPEINAVSLGISPKGIKKYTPAERRLKTAGDFKPIQLLGILGGSLPVDPILNAISGRTTMLKKELEVEKKEHLLAVFGALFDSNYFTKTLKIPADYIKGFQYYCIEDKNFAEVLTSKNKTKIEFLIVPLAEKYNKIIACENE